MAAMSAAWMAAVATAVLGATSPECPLPPVTMPAEVFLTVEQERWLGELMVEQYAELLTPIDAPELTAYLDAQGERIATFLPTSSAAPDLVLLDAPFVNAFSVTGDRIYVTRKMVAFLESEEELLGLLAHELGHVVVRHSAVQLSEQLREVLGITSLTDQASVVEAFHGLIDNARKAAEIAGRSERDERREQIEADRFSLHALARAGYGADGFIRLFDRLAGTEGKTGNWLTDLLGTTRRGARRLRAMSESAKALPPACVAEPSRDPEAFRSWQAAVVAWRPRPRTASTDRVVSRRSLDPPFRAEIDHIAFSPDGKTLLAQDDAGFFILDREPFAIRFRIEAPNARFARFAADSQTLSWHNRELRVETWDLTTRERTFATELVVLEGCHQTQLSRDGSTFACLTAGSDLVLLDTRDGHEIVRRKDFYRPQSNWERRLWTAEAVYGIDFDFIDMEFSRDRRWFLAGRDTRTFAWDFRAGSEFDVPDPVHRLLAWNFALLGEDRLVGTDRHEVKRSGVVRFPDGEVLQRLELRGHITPSECGTYLLLRPSGRHPVAAMHLAENRYFLANRTPALGIYGDVSMSERKSGELALYAVDAADSDGPLATVALPPSRLGSLRERRFSPDFGWLALSSRGRGSVFRVGDGQRTIANMPGFTRAAISTEGRLIADFPKWPKESQEAGEPEQTERRLMYVTADTAQVEPGPALLTDEGRTAQLGAYLIDWTGKNLAYRRKVALTVRDAHTGAELWTRRWDRGAPSLRTNPPWDRLVLQWAADDANVRPLIQLDPDLRTRILAAGEASQVLEVVDGRSGKRLGKVVLGTGDGTIGVDYLAASGDYLAVADSASRVRVYRVSTGALLGRVIGTAPTLAVRHALLAVGIGRGVVRVHGLPGLERVHEHTSATDVSEFELDDATGRLYVLTDDQMVEVIEPRG